MKLSQSLDEILFKLDYPKVIADRLLLIIDSEIHITDGGIFLPEDSGNWVEASDFTGIVLAIGPEVKDINVGDTVMYKHAGKTIKEETYDFYFSNVQLVEENLTCVVLNVSFPRVKSGSMIVISRIDCIAKIK